MGILFSCTSYHRLMNEGGRQDIPAPVQLQTKDFLNLKLVQVEIGGELYWFLFDTGAPTLITPELADKINLKKRMSSSLRDSNSKRNKSYIGSIDEIKISGVSFTHIAAYVAPMDAAIFKCYNIQGILGANMMSHATWRVNKMGIYVGESVRDFDVSSAVEIPIVTNGQKSPYAAMSLDSLNFSRVLLDYGSNGGFDLTEKVFHEFDYIFDSNWVETYGYVNTSLYGTKYDTALYQLKTLHLGEFTIDSVEVERINHNKQKIGCDIFNQYDVVLSWDSSLFYFTPAEKSNYDYRDFGISFNLVDGEVRVTFLGEYSEALQENIHVGDKVVQLNNFIITTENFCEFLENRREILKGEVLYIKWINQEGNQEEAEINMKARF